MGQTFQALTELLARNIVQMGCSRERQDAGFVMDLLANAQQVEVDRFVVSKEILVDLVADLC